MKIRLRISIVHFYLVILSDKSFLLWKWNLWCVIWFSLWKWPFILYDSCYSRGAPAPFHFMVGGSSGRRESETLVLSFFEKPDFTQANYICRYLDLFLWLCWSTVNPITIHEPLINLAFTALPRITADDCHNHNTEQPLLLSLKPRLL